MHVFVVAEYVPAHGGTSTQTRLIAERLAAAGERVVVLTRRLDPSWPARSNVGGVEVVRVGPPAAAHLSEKRALLALASWLRRHRHEIAMVQVMQWYDVAVVAHGVGLGARAHVLWAAHGDARDVLRGGDGLRRAVLWRRRRAFAACHHLALSGEIADELAELEVGPSARVGLPIDIERFQVPTAEERDRARGALALLPSEFVVAYVGHLRRLKRVDVLVDAIHLLRRHGVPARLVVVGGDRGMPDDTGSALRGKVEAEGLGQAVTFTGAVDDPERFLHAADAFALASEREGLPNAILEAMACGVPVVAPPSAGGRVALEGGGGVIPAANSAPAMAEALRRLWDEPGVRAQLAAEARQIAVRSAADAVLGDYRRAWEGSDA